MSENPAKKSALQSSKAIINQRFGDKACYKVEEVEDCTQNECSGLAILQKKGPCLYRCTLQLPDIVVVSDPCRKKKDAEQSAAEKAIEKLGIHQKEYNPTVEEAWGDLVDRLTFLFSDEFLSSPHPLRSHFRAALSREVRFSGCVPVSVIAVYDAKITNICKYINPTAAVNLLQVISLILKAAEKIPDLVRSFDGEQLSLQRIKPYPFEVESSSVDHEMDLEFELYQPTPVEIIRIPAPLDKAAESLTLNLRATGYYLDDIARELGITEASDILISRSIGKGSSEMRMYYTAPKQQRPRVLSESTLLQVSHCDDCFNARATYLSGQEISGTAILASVGYRWKSTDLFHEDVSLRTYYRMLANMIPSGAYGISREAILAAKLPIAFTTKNNWRGSFPRDTLCSFCRSHHLSEPVFSIKSNSLNSTPDLSQSCKKLKVIESSKEEKSSEGLSAASEDPEGDNGAFHCEVTLYTKSRDLILRCSPQESFKKQTDAIQVTALKVLSLLNVFFEKPGMIKEKLKLIANKLDIHLYLEFDKKFALCHPVHKFENARPRQFTNFYNTDNTMESEPSIDIRGESSGVTPSNGSLACICYTVSLVIEGGTKAHLESCEQFEFEIGNEAVLPHLESAVTQMAVGQSAQFQMDLLPVEFILAAAGDSAYILSLLSSKSCKLEFCLTLLGTTEPMEERMEKAFFSPPLAKQRVEFAVEYIKETSATSLVDFGCGSGSLLDSLLLYPTSLEKIVGIDISQKALARAAKSLNSKLDRLMETKEPISKMISAVLFDGSILQFDSRLYGFDIATCLEVIEHMEEKDASIFGNVVLESFCPKILIVSTPNYEYNVILQNSTSQSREEDDINEAQSIRFRNHDHKFEWTRAQFNEWASGLATKHNYDLEFSGVGGAGDVEPGFASQIAIFRRRDNSPKSVVLVHNFAQIWEWNRKSI